MSMRGVCAKCGFIFLLEYGIDCPACNMAARAERVAQAFRPVDPLRTAMGIPGSFKVDKHGTIHEYTWHGEDMRGTIYEEKPEADDAKYRIPKGEASQLYELRRLFRL